MMKLFQHSKLNHGCSRKTLMSEEFKILTDAQHALQAPYMYIGSTSVEEQEVVTFGETKKFNIVPGLLKII
jgi:hypothetical protein